MKHFEQGPKWQSAGENAPEPERVSFTPEQQKEIEAKRQILAGIAYFIGKDFNIPVELNEPGAGWHWDFEKNKIKVDPKDLAEKPMDYLRFVIGHEAGHRRISRTEMIPPEEWQERGFAFLMNAIEDPRDNNFVAESYPKFREQMERVYEADQQTELAARQKAQRELGYQPRFMQAGFEYIKQWFREASGEEMEISGDLPEEVKNVVSATLAAAQDSWWRYPSRAEADESEELIKKYAAVSYKINREKIWPEFKKLVEVDLQDQQMQEFMKDRQPVQEEEMPPELKDKLTPEQQRELTEAREQAMQDAKEKQDQAGGEGKPSGQSVDLSSLSEELKQKIKDYINSLPAETKQELVARAAAALKDYEEAVNEELRGKLTEDPVQKAERQASADEKAGSAAAQPRETPAESAPAAPTLKLKEYQELVRQELSRDANAYEKYRREVLPLVDRLENDLREIFMARREQKWHSGFKRGKRIDIKHRIQERAKDVPAVESKAWERRELPQEKDYAMTLLIDLSGSMRGEKINETFKSAIVLAEVLNRLSIKVEILGFNDRLYEYQPYGQALSQAARENMGGMLLEVDDFGTGGKQKALWNDDGWALAQASARLKRQDASEKFIFVLSDGVPAESPGHRGPEYELKAVVERVLKETDQKLIGLGIGSGTGHVKNYYPLSLADIDTEQMAEKLAETLRAAIANPDQFRR